MKLHCPECRHGTVDVYEAETSVTIAPAYNINDQPLEERLRPCLVAACTRCEFVIEIDKTGRPV